MKRLKNIHISLYWKCQLIGWFVASLYWQYTGYEGEGFLISLALLYFVSDVFFYILLTHIYRNLALKNGWNKLPLNELAKRIIPSIILLGLAFMIVTLGKIYVIQLIVFTDNVQPLRQFIKLNWLQIFMAGIRLMSIWVLAYHLYHYAQREINIAKENARLAIMTKDAQLNNLSAQLNPHFFFNSINNIKALVIEDPIAARRAIDLLAELLRTSLYRSDFLLIPLKEEISLVRDYLELEKLRLEERLQQCIEVDEDLGSNLVPRLSIQTLVENAIKHGINKQIEGGLVKVKVMQVAEGIEISVQNPGKLDRTKSMEGVGLKNLKERIDLQFKEKGKFHIEQRNGIVLSTLLIPYV
jgi:sensor histidine kinase YesM